ncbi:hypothetical protein ACFLU4_08115 [Chloroflexota bacterium]
MNWHKWYRLAATAVVLALVATFIMLPAPAHAATLTIRPNAAGDETNLTPNTGANYAAVDDVTSDDDTTYVARGTDDVWTYDLYNLPDTTVSGKGKINNVTVYIHARSSGKVTQTSAYIRIKTNGTAYNGTEQTITGSYATYSTQYITNPQTTNEWTWVEVNALQAGLGMRRPTTGKESRCTQLWVVVDYTPSTWESYREVGHTTVWGTVGDPYNSTYHVAYMYGDNYSAGQSYAAGFYDNDGTKIGTDVSGSLATNALSAEFDLNTDNNATAGLWHSVVFDTAFGSPPVTYAATSGAAGYVVEDDFEVAAEAIPEFPEVTASIGVAGLCFGFYYWMRRRKIGHVKA